MVIQIPEALFAHFSRKRISPLISCSVIKVRIRRFSLIEALSHVYEQLGDEDKAGLRRQQAVAVAQSFSVDQNVREPVEGIHHILCN